MLSIEEKKQLLRSNLPHKAIAEVARKHKVHRVTVHRAINDYNTSSPWLQDLISIAHDNAIRKVEATRNTEEIAELAAQLTTNIPQTSNH